MTHVLAHDLFWWRCHDDGLQTTVSIFWPELYDDADAQVRMRWFDSSGTLAAEHTRPLAGGTHLVISSIDPPVAEALGVTDGVLSVEVVGVAGASSVGDRSRDRLYGVIDWCSPGGDVAMLHSDHCVLDAPEPLELTEVVLRPAAQHRQFLVFLTAAEPLPAGSWTLSLTNASGSVRSAVVASGFPSWTVNRVDLEALFGDLVAFAGDGELSLAGVRAAHPTFERPYVVSEDPVLAAYHGGDRYDWEANAPHHWLMLGEGEVNPMLVVQSPELTTDVTFLHTHGDLDEDYWIGLRLYDEAGALVVHEPRWHQARWNVLSSASFEGVVPGSFVGHAAFTFSEPGRDAYPGHVQALMAYRGEQSCARIMAWSDEWNTPQRRVQLRRSGAHYESYFRTPVAGYVQPWLGITYAGSHELDGVGAYTIRVRGDGGSEVSVRRELGPWATDWAPLTTLVPAAAAMVAAGSCLVTVESEADLAMVCFVRHNASGRWAAEHFMSAPVAGAAGEVWPAGS